MSLRLRRRGGRSSLRDASIQSPSRFLFALQWLYGQTQQPESLLLCEKMSADTEQLPHHLIALSEAIDDAVITTDLASRVTTWNTAAERLYGYSAAEMKGQLVTKILPADRDGE